MSKVSKITAAVIAALPAWALAQQTVDGVKGSGEYTIDLTSKAIQNTPTAFGDNENEIDAAYANYTVGSALEVLLTGNVKGNGDGLILFIDCKTGGGVANTAPGGFGQLGSIGGQRVDDWGTDLNGNNATPDPSPGGGSILSPGFNPDYAITIDRFANNPNGEYHTHVIDLTQPNDNVHPDKDIELPNNNARLLTSDPAAVSATGFYDPGGSITHAFDNTNTGGVFGYNEANPPGLTGDPEGATTGLEFSFDSDFLLHTDGHAVRIMAAMCNEDGTQLSNQFLPGVNGLFNLGTAGGIGGTPLVDTRGFGDLFYLNVFEPTHTGNGTWSTATFTGTATPNGAEQTAKLDGSTASTVTLDTSVTLGVLKLDNPAGITLNRTGTNTLTLSGGSGAAALFAVNGGHTISVPVTFATDTRVDAFGGGFNGTITFTGTISIAGGKSFTKAGGGVVTINGTQQHGASAVIAADVGTLNINTDAGNGILNAPPTLSANFGAALNLGTTQHLFEIKGQSGGTVTLLAGADKLIVTDRVTTNSGGKIDLKNNDLVDKFDGVGTFGTTNSYSGVTGQIASGRNNGAWNGQGLVTSMSDAATGLTALGVAKAGEVLGINDGDTTTWNGETVFGTDTLVKYTFSGDANLSGHITVDDYTLIDAEYAAEHQLVPVSNPSWRHGDFDYNGKVNIDDYALIDTAFINQGGVTLSPGLLAEVSAVPEPTAAILMAAPLLLLKRRRK